MSQRPPITAVFDTNVMVSAWITPGGLCSELLNLTEASIFRLAMSTHVIDEYVRVLSRPALTKLHGVPVERIRFMLEKLAEFATLVDTPVIPPVIQADPTDDVFLACAVVSRAQYIVSGDHHLLELGRHQGVTILRPHEMLAAFHADLM